ncbi:hypothetical protein Tco_0773038 [Tanacetum coccineum]|uniref:Uncharacterized protein n=1 Tax=Tanacetum coccineum TaxID=301880 RepID=A0ABQ4ZND1_9ASTR
MYRLTAFLRNLDFHGCNNLSAIFPSSVSEDTRAFGPHLRGGIACSLIINIRKWIMHTPCVLQLLSIVIEIDTFLLLREQDSLAFLLIFQAVFPGLQLLQEFDSADFGRFFVLAVLFGVCVELYAEMLGLTRINSLILSNCSFKEF